MAIREIISIGVIVSFLNYIRQFTRPINQLANQFNMIQSAVAGAERMFEIMDETTEFDQYEPNIEFRDIEGEVIFERVCFSYDKNVPVLKDISFRAEPGDMIALVGPTGAGKTTLINLLERFYDIDAGSITIDGENIKNIIKTIAKAAGDRASRCLFVFGYDS